MILLCGIPSESPLALVASALDDLRADYLVLNQRHFRTTHIEFSIVRGALTGTLEYDGRVHNLERINGVYTRLMDHRSLPELAREKPDSPAFRHCSALHDALTRWMELTPARVVNRTAPMCSNSSKPYQAQLIRQCGLGTPDTLISSNPDAVRRFRSRHGEVIFKSISGVRSIVQTLDDSHLPHLDKVRWCPTQFQRRLPGTDVRVHVVGQEVFATRIASTATDYRYAQSQVGEAAELSAMELSPNLSERCVHLAASLGLAFAGIDLKITPDGDVYCFEVNPCPGYSYYEAHTGQPISHAVARYLLGHSLLPKEIQPEEAASPSSAFQPSSPNTALT